MKHTDFKVVLGRWVWMGVMALCLTSCNKDDETAPITVLPETETMKLLLSVPTTAVDKRDNIGDPGTAVPEGEDWDRMAIIVTYPDDSQIDLPDNSKVMFVEIALEQFKALPNYDDNPDIKLLTLDVFPGTVNIYGVTYSSDEAAGLLKDIRNCKTGSSVKNLTISNDYAADNMNKFVSVATGFYHSEGNLNMPADFVVQEGGTGEVGVIPTMTLTRLATKIDIQWDAEDAYTAGYTDVKTTGFQYAGTASGYLFPSLNHIASLQPQTWDFYNKTEISQRNGRTYHYTFTDGKNVPKVTFLISANSSTEDSISDKKYIMNFTSPLKPAAWYKVNATIKGLTGNGSITVFD